MRSTLHLAGKAAATGAALIGASTLLFACASGDSGPKPALGGAGRFVEPSEKPVAEEARFYEQDTRRTSGVQQTVSIRLDKLPIGEVPQLDILAQSRPASVPAGSTPATFEITPSNQGAYYAYEAFKPVVAKPLGFALLEARVGPNYANLAWSSEGAATVFCGVVNTSYGSVQTYYGYGNKVLQAHFEGFIRSDGKVSYGFVDGWFDTETCAFRVDSSAQFALTEIMPGLVYGFRSCSTNRDPAPPKNGNTPVAPDATTDKEKTPCVSPNQLTIMTPRAVAFASTYQKAGAAPTVSGYSPVARFTLPLRHGSGNSATLTIARNDLLRWAKALQLETEVVVPVDATTQTFNINVEVQQATRDSSPAAQIHLSTPQPPAPQPRLVRSRDVGVLLE